MKFFQRRRYSKAGCAHAQGFPFAAENRRLTLLSALILVFAGAVAGASAAAESAPTLDDFLRHPEIEDVRISPEGTLLAVTVPKDDRTDIMVLKADTLAPVAYWNLGADVYPSELLWVDEERLVFRVASREGVYDYPVREHGLFTAKVGEPVERHGAVHRDDVLRGVPAGQPGWLFVEREGEAVGTHPQLFKLNASSGVITRHVRGHADAGDFVIDADGHVRYFLGVDRDLTSVMMRRDGDEWVETYRGRRAHSAGVPQHIGPDGKTVYVFRTTPAGTRGVETLDLATDTFTPLSSDPRFDAASLLIGADRKTVLGVIYEDVRPRIDFVAPDHPEVRQLRSLQKTFGDVALSVLDRTLDGRQMLIGIHSDRDPGQVYLFDRETRQARLLFASHGWLDPEALATQRAVSFKARDGKRIDAYLWLPPGREAKALPLVVRPHGGPHGVRDIWGFDAEAQLLASRGYAVLTVNFRGSAGYGEAFERAGYGQWGRAMIDDITDAVRWTTAEGIADAGRVCVYGASYGAYAALMSVVREPDLYRCAIGYAGMYDMPEMFEHDSTASGYLASLFGEYYPTSAAEREWQSPALRAAEISVPVMLAHGSKDERIPLAQFDRMVSALKQAGRPAEVALMESGEGHGFTDPANVRKFYTTMLEFLDRHLGSRAASNHAAP
jgi:dipeptidyl aminopeptidase/acylaminoacyl peptidase